MIRMNKSYITYFIISIVILSACKKSEINKDADDILLQIGDSILTQQAVVEQIPNGLSANDSVNLFDAIVKDWVNTLLLQKVAEENLPNLEKINQMVDDYRSKLIILEYRKLMAAGKDFQISEDSIRQYYDLHKKEFKLKKPIVKGLFVKVPQNAAELKNVKKWVFSATPEDIEKLEKYWMTELIQYDYFMDKWIDWSVVKDQIPYNFKDDNSFVANNKNFETAYDESVYFVHIAETMKSGEIMPFEYASNHIREILIERDRKRYDEELYKSFYQKAIMDKNLKIVSYDSKKLID